MHEFPDTRESLLLQVKDAANCEAWERFAQIYRPVIYRIAAARGLQDADAHDLTQQVLITVASAIGRWEQRNDGTKFRNWLSRVTKNAILNALTRRPRDQASGGTTAFSLLDNFAAADAATEELILLEYRREVYLQAAEIVQADVTADTWKAFELTVISGMDIEQVAAELGKSPGAVYTARSRVMFRLRKLVKELEEQE